MALSRRLAGCALAALLAALVAACSDPEAEALAARRAELDAARSDGTDASGRLHLARDAVSEHGDDPALLLVGAEALLELRRFEEAADWADRGLAGAGEDEDLTADLNWARGSAHFGVFGELQEADAWRSANSDLERATRAGRHRADAAYLLTRMQGLGGHGSDARREKFGRFFLQLEGQGKRADAVRELLEAGG